jgi:hypothetical protein
MLVTSSEECASARLFEFNDMVGFATFYGVALAHENLAATRGGKILTS